MVLSVISVVFATLGYITPLEGALLQEVIDLLSIANALRAAYYPDNLSDMV
jgi:cation transport ATPase